MGRKSRSQSIKRAVIVSSWYPSGTRLPRRQTEEEFSYSLSMGLILQIIRLLTIIVIVVACLLYGNR